MLIYYSMAAYELLEQKMSLQEKEELHNVFFRVGDRMGLAQLPNTYAEWVCARQTHLEQDLEKSELSEDLFKQYRKHLGVIRYRMLLEAQKLVVPPRVSSLLNFGSFRWMQPLVPLYQFSRKLKMEWLIKDLLLPSAYKEQIKALDLYIS
jgi:hypothetical protein